MKFDKEIVDEHDRKLMDMLVPRMRDTDRRSRIEVLADFDYRNNYDLLCLNPNPFMGVNVYENYDGTLRFIKQIELGKGLCVERVRIDNVNGYGYSKYFETQEFNRGRS